MESTKLFGYLIITLLVIFVSTPCVVKSLNVASTLCIKEERVALLKIKKDLKDPHNYLFSWVRNDCCNWTGIECDNQTGHVLNLDLQLTYIGGDINPSITDLKHLTHLDLSDNNFEGITIPEFIGSLNTLRYLGLSNANFSGMVPTHLGNLSHLHYLDISSTFDSETLWVRDVSWFSALTSLQFLGMDYVKITSTSHKFFRVVIMMPSLLKLHLSSCNLGTLPPSLPFQNITSPLSVLDLSENPFNSPIPPWLFNLSNLTELNLHSTSLRESIKEKTSLRGPLPVFRRGNLCKLQNLDLSNNYLTGDITQMLETLSSCSNQSLERLDLSSNHLTGKLPHSLGQFNSLFDLDLSSNSLSGPIPASIGNLSKLSFLYLEGNMLNRKIPESIGQLTQLNNLNLLQNNWEGTMTNIHFHNLTNLYIFSLSSKTISFAFKMTQDWIPPFNNLYHVEIRDCQVGPTFPNWLRNLKFLRYVILENAGISGEIPHWFYDMSSQISYLDLSQNKLSGYLPKILNFSSLNFGTMINIAFNQFKGSIPLWSGVRALDLSNNLLSRAVPTNIGEKMSDLMFLDLSNNNLIGSIPVSINRIQNLQYVDLSNNYLTGDIPVFWMSKQKLSIVDLSNNSLSGRIPTSICSLPSLSILEFSNNNLLADLSTTFTNCTRLQTLSLGNNMFFGSMPKEINKNLPLLSELLLRGNTLTGSIPEELCRLPFLHLLDLSENNLSGSIPKCLGDLRSFKQSQTYFINSTEPFIAFRSLSYTRHIELILKGRIIEYMNRMAVHSTIDLSNNDLCGKIPDKLTELIHLGTLNLSWNKLTGNIPNNIGLLIDLESLDLSHNCLSGSIPPSMVSMTFLSYLNLAYNNLSGEIPVANQFGTFDPSIYVGNPQLCGNSKPTNCSLWLPGNGGEQGPKHKEDNDKTEKLGLYGSIALGYITGFWLVCGSLVLNRSWRHAYFKLVFDIRDKLLVLIAVNLARATRWFGLERN